MTHTNVRDSLDNIEYYPVNANMITIDDGYMQNFNESGSVYVTLNSIPQNYTLLYSVIDDGTLRYSGTIDINESNSIVSVALPVNHHVISPCICIMQIELFSNIDTQQIDQLTIHRLIVNAFDTVENEELMIIPTTNINQISTPSIILDTAVKIPYLNQSINVRSSIITENDNSNICEFGILSETSADIQNLSSNENQDIYENIVQSQLSIELNFTMYDDGFISILFQIGYGNEWSNNIGCISTKLDLLSPIISIDSPSEIDEKFGLLIIDASSSYDPKWGREHLQYVWSYQKIDDPYSTPISSMGDNSGIFTFDATKSGTYQFNLSVIDSSFHVSSESIIVSINNIRPQANMRIDSVPVNDGDVIRLTNDQSWNVDATYTYDTQNDIDNLSYTWFLDGNPIMSGIQRKLIRPENVNQMHELTLMVEDDDGAVDWVSVTIGIAGTPSDPNESSVSMKIVAGISVTILFSTIFVFTIFARRSQNTPHIRQWNTTQTETTESRTED